MTTRVYPPDAADTQPNNPSILPVMTDEQFRDLTQAMPDSLQNDLQNILSYVDEIEECVCDNNAECIRCLINRLIAYYQEATR